MYWSKLDEMCGLITGLLSQTTKTKAESKGDEKQAQRIATFVAKKQ